MIWTIPYNNSGMNRLSESQARMSGVSQATISVKLSTVESRLLELGYVKFCQVEASIWIKNAFLLLPPTIIQRRGIFYKFKLPEVQINLHFG